MEKVREKLVGTIFNTKILDILRQDFSTNSKRLIRLKMGKYLHVIFYYFSKTLEFIFAKCPFSLQCQQCSRSKFAKNENDGTLYFTVRD